MKRLTFQLNLKSSALSSTSALSSARSTRKVTKL